MGRVVQSEVGIGEWSGCVHYPLVRIQHNTNRCIYARGHTLALTSHPFPVRSSHTHKLLDLPDTSLCSLATQWGWTSSVPSVNQNPNQTVVFGQREGTKGFPFRHKIRSPHVHLSSEGIVHLASDPVAGNLPMSVSSQLTAPKGRDSHLYRGRVIGSLLNR